MIAEKQQVLAVLEKEQEGLKKEMDKFYDLYMSDNISKDGFGRKYRPLEERMEQLDAEMPRLESEIDFLKIQNLELIGAERLHFLRADVQKHRIPAISQSANDQQEPLKTACALRERRLIRVFSTHAHLST